MPVVAVVSGQKLGIAAQSGSGIETEGPGSQVLKMGTVTVDPYSSTLTPPVG